jgi:hypothetical protein
VPTHVILDNASLQLGADVATLKELACYTNHLELSPDVSVTTLDTMCGSIDYPGAVKWSLVATLYQSWDTDGTEAVLEPLVTAGVPCEFVVSADKDQAISASNPGWQGQVIPQPYSPLNGDAGDGSEVSLEWSLTGPPTKITSPPTATTAGSSSKSS